MADPDFKRIVDDVRFHNDIADLIGSYVPLKRAGSTFRALCPFHKEKTPSFHVNPQRQIYHCFGCGKGGDAYRFLMDYEGVDFMTALRMLAERGGVTLKLDAQNPETSDKALLLQIHADVAEFYRRCLTQLPAAEPARQYLRDRRLDGETAEAFGIGYAPDRWDACLRWADKHKIRHDLLDKAGLVVRREEASRDGADAYYDRFRNRVMFPIRDEQGRPIGFSGRILQADAKAAKYVNSPETPLFHKSRVLYALDKARRPMVESREAIVCEGQIDVIRCHQAGFSTAVASQGTAFTEEHARILHRYADSVVIVFDPDTAGQDGAIKAAGIFLESGLAVRIATLPEGQDADLYLQKRGADAFRQALAQARSVVSFQIGVLAKREDLKKEANLVRASKRVLETVARSPNEVLKSAMLKEAADRLGVPMSAMQDDMNHMLRQATRRTNMAASRAEANPTDAPPAPTPPAHPPEEVVLCEHLVTASENPDLADLVRQYLPLDLISDPDCRAIAAASLQAAESRRDILDLVRAAPDATDERQRLLAEVLMAPVKTSGREFSRLDAVQSQVLRLWHAKLRNERATLPESESGRRSQITRDLKALGAWKTGIDVIKMEMP
jgi:DNA primase